MESQGGPVTIAAFRDLPQAEAARGLLQANGIDAVLHDDKLIALNWFLSNAIGGVKLVVPAAQAGEARRILEEIEQQDLAETFEEPEPDVSRWSWMKVAVVALMAMLLAVAIGQSFATGRQRPPRPVLAQRPYLLELPPGFDPRVPAPLIIGVHGYSDDADTFERLLHLRAAARAHGAIYVRVEGTKNPDGQRYWNAGAACCDFHGQRTDDIGYLDAVLDDLSARYAIDPARVYLAGHSNGGFFVHAYACARARRIAGIASVAGGGPAERCAAAAPVAVVEIHGDADELVSTGGGNVATALPRLREYGVPESGNVPLADFPPMRATLDRWATRDDCAPAVAGAPLDLDPAIPGAETAVLQWPSCRSGGVALWMVHGGGHQPDFTDGFGEALWSFFAAHPVSR